MREHFLTRKDSDMLSMHPKVLYKIVKNYRYQINSHRLLNLFKVMISMAVSRILKHPIIMGYPLLLMVEPTNRCNLKCPMCPSGSGELTRTLGKLKLDLFSQIIDDIGDHLILIQFWNQGEPFLHEDLLDMVKLAKSKGIPTMTSTNGHFLNSLEHVENIIDSGLDEIIVSLDGVDQTTYEKYRIGGNFQRVVNGIRKLSKAKEKHKTKRPLINLQFLVLKHNQHQIDRLVKLAKELHVDILTLKSVQVYNRNQAKQFLPDNRKYRRYVYQRDFYRLKSQIKNWCYYLWYGSVLNWDGTIVPCCFDKNCDYPIANLSQFNSSFYDIWKGKELQNFRKKILKQRRDIDMCKNCFEGLSQPMVYYFPIS